MNTLIFFCAFLIAVYAQLDFPSTSGNRIVATHQKMRMYMAKGAYYIQGQQKPAATNMLKMAWDSTLAASAQTYANTCPNGPSGTTGIGENMYDWYTTSPVSPLDGYEFSDYGLSSLTMSSSILASGVADATQMAWAKTKLVGCGVANCGPDPAHSNKTRIAVVCHYSPKGNIIGEVIYEQGLSCSNCPTPTTCELDMGFPTGLCV